MVMVHGAWRATIPSRLFTHPASSSFPQGYTVRSIDGYRYTEYVDYDAFEYKGHWTNTSIDAELYDLNAE
jgi:hypothetical protein